MYATNEDMLEYGKSTGSNGGSLKDKFVDLKVTKDNTEKDVRIRLIGFPFAFVQYTPHKQYTDEDGKKRREEVDFPDKDEVKKYARCWTLPKFEHIYGEDPWKKLGYAGSLRFAQNVLVRHNDGSFEVKILEKGKMVFEHFTNFENSNKKRNEERGTKRFITWLGGEKTHELLVTAKFNPKKVNVPDIVVSPEPEIVQITEEEIEALAEAGKPSEQELADIYKMNPAFENLPEWIWYGYPLRRIYANDPVGGKKKDGSKSTSKGDLSMSADDNDDAEEAPAPKAAAKKAPAKAKPADEEDDSAFAAPEAASGDGESLDADW